MCCIISNESTNQFDVSPLGSQYFCNLPTKSKFCCDDLVILQGTFILNSSQVLLISTVRSIYDLVVIKPQVVVPQKLVISDFPAVKYNDDAINTYQFVGSVKLSG